MRNEAANLLLSAYAARTQAQEIPFAVHACLPQLLSVSESDLCVLLSNALENAIHAYGQLREDEAWDGIDVQLYEENGKVFLQIINDCREDVRFEHGIPVTARPGHGIGMQSICTIVERYQGVSSFSVQNGKFILRISL